MEIKCLRTICCATEIGAGIKKLGEKLIFKGEIRSVSRDGLDVSSEWKDGEKSMNLEWKGIAVEEVCG